MEGQGNGGQGNGGQGNQITRADCAPAFLIPHSPSPLPYIPLPKSPASDSTRRNRCDSLKPQALSVRSMLANRVANGGCDAK